MAPLLHAEMSVPALTVFRYWYLFYKRTTPPVGARASRDFVSIRPASPVDRAALGALAVRRPIADLIKWMREPETWVFLAFLGNRAIGYDCVTRHLPRTLPFSELRLGAEEVWVRDVFVLPEFRRLRVGRALRAERNAVIRRLGYYGTQSAIAEENVASLVANYDSSVWKVDGLTYRRVLFHRHIRYFSGAWQRLDGLVTGARAIRAGDGASLEARWEEPAGVPQGTPSVSDGVRARSGIA